MEDYTDVGFDDLIDRLKQMSIENRTSDLLKLLKTLLTKNVTVQDWNTLIRDIAPLYEAMLALNDCMVDLIPKVQYELSIATGSSDSALSRIIALENWNHDLEDKKFNKTGGDITGPVTITDKLDVQSLTVHGTTTTVDTDHLSVKDAVIETNVGVTADNIPLLSGYVIHIGNGYAYGIVYDKRAQSVKLGLVEKNDNGNYQFIDSETEGQAVALRADTDDLDPGHLVVWNRDLKRFETGFQVAQDATAATVAQRNANGELLTADPESDNAAVPRQWLEGRYSTSLEIAGQLQLLSNALTKAKSDIDAELEKRLKVHENTSDNQIPFYPVIPKLVRNVSNDPTQGFYQAWEQLIVEAINNSIPKRTTYGAVQTKDPRVATDSVNLQYADAHYVTINTATPKAIYAVDSNKKPVNLPFTMEPTANTVAQRAAGGVLRVGTPIADTDATPKKYVEDGFVQKQTTTDNASFVYAYDKNGDKTFQLTGAPNAGSVAFRGDGGVLKVGDPVALKDAVNLEYFTTRLNAVTGTSPYFTHNICITRTVDGVADTIRVTVVCTQPTKVTSVTALHDLIDQLKTVSDSPGIVAWHGVCKMTPYNMSEGIPGTLTVYSGELATQEGTYIIAFGDSAYPNAMYRVDLEDVNRYWTVSDDVLNAVVGGTTA